jgi:glycosyltransferase involved in cell wall biosynthesis
MHRSRQSGRRTRVLYCGRLDRDKDFDLVLHAIPQILRNAGVHVTVVGAGGYEADVKAIRHPRFRYLGFLSDRPTLRAVYAAHDVFLAPGRFETFGLTALEAAAAGLIVVGPDQGGTAELLRQMQSPLMFRSGDRAEFLNRIEAAIEGDWTTLVGRQRAVASGYGSWSDAVARQMAVYESMTRERTIAETLDRTA